MHHLPLDSWRLGAVPPRPSPQQCTDDRASVREWLPATLPCHVHALLVAAGRLAPLDSAAAIEAARWVEGRDWWLESPFELALAEGERAWLTLERVDFIAELWLDGRCIAELASAIAPVELELTPHLRGERHTLALRLRGAEGWPAPAWHPWERGYARLARWLHPGKASLTPFHPRLGWLRAPMQAGWDFAPRLHAIGLPGRAWIERSGPRRLAAVAVGRWQFGTDGTARSQLTATIEAAQPTRATLRVAWRLLGGETSGEQCLDLRLPAGRTRLPVALAIPNARRWQPWEQGEPHRYALRVTVSAEGQPDSAWQQTIGLREVETAGAGWRVNGQPFFARGVNWVPADLLPGTVGRERYATLLQAARARGVNLLRLWGGGGPERPDFYELCDELGLMLWQEFPFACAFLDHFPRDAAFRQQVATEARGMVRALRHHPSILCWGAGNEFSAARNRWLVRALADAAQREDGTRPVRGPSPHGADRHEWHVWHGLAPLHRYQRERALLLSEFGLQAPPALASLARFLPPAALWPPGAAWEDHQADLGKLHAYAHVDNAPPADSAARFIERSQAAQAQGLQLAIERMRQRKAAGAAGVLLWQWNEPWPAISWALIAHDGTPKRAAEGLARWYAPQALSLAFDRRRRWRRGDTLRATLWAVNDLARPSPPGEARLYQGEQLLGAWPLTMAPHSARPVAALRQPLRGDGPLRLEWWHGGERQSSSDYALSLPGPRRAPLGRTLYRTVAEWVMRW